jgi:hypothetical protein
VGEAVTLPPRTAVLVPSRGRPGQFARLAEAVMDTTAGRVELHPGLDDDDPRLDDYIRLCQGTSWAGTVFHVQPRMSLSAWTNKLARWALHGSATMRPDYLVSLGDDHLPLTQDWDVTLAGHIESLDGPGWAYGDDLLQGERLPTAWMQSAGLVDALGWMMLPGCGHMYVDNVVLELGQHTGRIVYDPTVRIEHRHPVAGKAEPDQTYAATNHAHQYAADLAAFETWKAAGLDEASRIVKSLRH